MGNYWKRVRNAAGDGKRSLSQDITLKHRDNISGCMLEADRVLRGCENRILVTNRESLKTAILQQIHEVHLAEHSGQLLPISDVQRLKDAQGFDQTSLASAQQHYETSGKLIHRQPEKFKVEDKVWLDLHHIKTPQL